METETIVLILFAIPAGLAASFLVAAAITRGPEDTYFMGCLRLLNTIVMRTIHRLRVLDREGKPCRDSLPPTGAFIIVANHRSGADPNIVGGTSRRWISFLMAKEYYETRGLRWLFRYLRAIPVNRDGNDMPALRRALGTLREGGVIGLFPEGGIRETDEIEMAKAGVALLAAKSNAPVVPLYIDGSPVDESVFKVLFMPSRTRVFCGEPLRFEGEGRRQGRAELEKFASLVIEEIAKLRRAARRELDAQESRETAPADSSTETPSALAHDAG